MKTLVKVEIYRDISVETTLLKFFVKIKNPFKSMT